MVATGVDVGVRALACHQCGLGPITASTLTLADFVVSPLFASY